MRTDFEVGAVGVALRNDTGAPLTGLDLLYRVEQWRSGGSFNIDKVEGAYSLDATRLDTGTWTPVPALDFLDAEPEVGRRAQRQPQRQPLRRRRATCR